MLATAEHEYSRWGYKQLIDGRMVDILQPDITWLGGAVIIKLSCHSTS
jgi:L-rhamnonate dehydratase